jgi:3-phenylpropionate/cinnamic acid dioxygenase small subunit
MKVPISTESLELRRIFEEILYYESSLISSNQLDEWTQLLHDDVRYWIPVRANRDIGTEDLHRANLICHIDDDRTTLVLRAQRATGGFSYADNPTPRVRHFVTNVRLVARDGEKFTVSSNVVVWRSHVGLPDHALVGGRIDRWVRNGDDWLLLERRVELDQDSIPAFSVLL